MKHETPGASLGLSFLQPSNKMQGVLGMLVVAVCYELVLMIFKEQILHSDWGEEVLGPFPLLLE